MPVLLFCVAFGLSMDYEVFLISRIREYWLDSGRTRADNDEAVALGLARTGRVVTAAALLMSISFAALIAAQVSFMRMFGLGLTLAVLVDATLVRMLLVPAFMHVLGRGNWWAPGPLALLHARFGDQRGGRDTIRRILACRYDGDPDWSACRLRFVVRTAAGGRRAAPATSCATRSWMPPPNCCWRPVTLKRSRSGRSPNVSG